MNRLAKISPLPIFSLAILLVPTPVLANAGIDAVFGFVGAIDTFQKWIETCGPILASVVLLETLLFKLLFRVSPGRAFLAALVLNLISTLAGAMWTRAGTNIDPIAIMLAPVFIILFVLLMIRSKSPAWYVLVAAAAIIAGTFISHSIAYVYPPLPPLAFLWFLLAPLVYCFGMTLLLEGLFIKFFFKGHGVWSGLLVVNVLSYILLAVLAPFYAENPHRIHHAYTYNLSSDSDPDEVMELIHNRRASNLYLLGLSNDPNLHVEYEPGFEYRLIRDASPAFVDPGFMVRIADDTLSLPNLSPRYERIFVWFRSYYGHWTDIREAIERNDSDALETSFAQAYSMFYLPDPPGEYIHRPVHNNPEGSLIGMIINIRPDMMPPLSALTNVEYIEIVYKDPYYNRDPEIGLSAVESALANLPDEPYRLRNPERLGAMRTHFEFCITAEAAIADHNLTALTQTYTDWKSWVHELGDEVTARPANFPTPETIIESLLDEYESDLDIPDL